MKVYLYILMMEMTKSTTTIKTIYNDCVGNKCIKVTSILLVACILITMNGLWGYITYQTCDERTIKKRHKMNLAD